MYRFELHTPPDALHVEGKLINVRMHELSNDDKDLFLLYSRDVETRIKTVDKFETMLRQTVLPGHANGTQVYLICQSKANTY